MMPKEPLLKWFAVCGLVVLGLPAEQAEAAESTNLAPVAVWDASAQISTAIGYRNNVLRSSIKNENSAFFLSVAEASLIRFSDSGALFMLYIFGDDTRYFDAPSVNYEQLFSGTARLSKPVGVRDEVGLEANYVYQHQILDASATEVELQRILVLGHSAALRPHWKRLLGGGWETQVEGAVRRQVFEHELDDYWESDGRVSLTRNYGNRSEISVGYLPLLRFYDTRNQYDSSGNRVPDTDLVYWQNEVGSEWRRGWNAERSWRTTSRLSYMVSRDNGSGYFDYDRMLFRQQVRWKKGVWDIRTTGRFGGYLYKEQTINDEPRNRSYAILSFRLERWLGKHWKCYAAGEYEWSMSNDPLDDYQSWMANAGVGYEF